jgi:hypothetical protein
VETQIDFSLAPEWAWGWCCFASGKAEWFGAMQNRRGIFDRVEAAPLFGQEPGTYAVRPDPDYVPCIENAH